MTTPTTKIELSQSNGSENNIGSSSSSNSNAEDPDFRRRNQQWVVLVDDEESIRYAVGDFLYDQGYEVTACADSNSLLDLIVTRNKDQQSSDNPQQQQQQQQEQQQQRLPDVIVSDVRMPESDKNGYELVEFLRSADTSIQQLPPSSKKTKQLLDKRSLLSLKNVPIVLLTAKAMTEDRIMGYRAGADVVLPKPFSPEELVSIIDGLIARRQQRLLRKIAPPVMVDQDDLQVLKREIENIRAIMQNNASKTVQKTTVVLTDKERTIVTLLSEGYTAREIAGHPSVRAKSLSGKALDSDEIETLKSIIGNLYETTKTTSKTELIRWARKVGYIPSS